MLPPSTLPSMPLVQPTFGTTPTFYIPPMTLIQRPNDMLSSPLGQHILPHRFAIPAFNTFDGSTDPYDHMLHHNQTMTLNAGNDRLLGKVFPANLWGPALTWFHKLPRYSINSFYELWAAFISQYLCLVRQKRNISFLQTVLK